MKFIAPGFPVSRPRRLRSTPQLRDWVRESVLDPKRLVQPLFVRPGRGLRNPVPSMPGVVQHSPDTLLADVDGIVKAGVSSVLLFGIPDSKDTKATGAYAKNGIVQTATRLLRKEFPQLLIVTDVCLCEYTSHGHCGMVHRRDQHVCIDNDTTLPLLARTAVSHAEAGADVIAPSDMMDGRIAAIRGALDKAGFLDTPIMSYAAKFSSAYYGPFRDVAESAPKFGDRRSYQMDPMNGNEALREVAHDIQEGADIVMVKPALSYLDILWRVKEEFGLPTAAYSVSAEYSMIKSAAANGWVDERALALETLKSMRRAGADIIITYWAKQVADWLKEA